MKNFLQRPYIIAAFSITLPFCALVLSYLISAKNELVPWCLPVSGGCTSISKAARQPGSLLLFQVLMGSSVYFIFNLWSYAEKWLKTLGDQDPAALRLMKIIGQSAAICLLIYLIFLGTKGAGYNFMRRFGVIFYFGGTGIAQLLFLRSLDKIKVNNSYYPHSLRKFSAIILYTMLLLGICQALTSLFINSDKINNIIEWNYAILMHLFFLLLAIEWKKELNNY